ncbi:hypothetical protein ACFY1L_52315 [Streptomyces sp. NPDC001663]|uniref:hypothetical protein n=1 Tax=Streptomyces sp. NPDC001663 TaxID=3364597 RepID=UPI0036945896
MGAPVWGTFSVRDHCLREAYLREVLLFDRLAIPYPDPLIEGERERWRRPNPADASQTWDPERLDVLLGILGTQESDGYNGARLAQLVRWGPQTWQELQSRLDTAHELTGNHFMDTSKGLHLVPGSEIPGIVEAVAVYPTQAQWRQEVRPTLQEPHTVSAAEALVAVPRPLLLPQPGGDELDVLRRAVDLAMDEEYAAMRAAYFDWFRDRVALLRTAAHESLADLRLDPGSVRIAEEELRTLWAREQKVVRKADKKRVWTRVEIGCTTLAAAGTTGLACAAALPVLGAGAALLSFAGWGIARWQAAGPDPRSLGGASMFVEAHRRLGWMQPDLAQHP